jgi:simple sugar transport system permease protein
VANFFGGALNTMAGGVGQISVATTSAAYRANIPALANLGAPGGCCSATALWSIWPSCLPCCCAGSSTAPAWASTSARWAKNPATADAAGVNVIPLQVLATCSARDIRPGRAVLHHGLHQGHLGQRGHHRGLGWLAVAWFIFAVWRSLNAIWGAYLFGFLTWLYLYIPGLSRSARSCSRCALSGHHSGAVVVSLRKKRENQPPAHLGCLTSVRKDKRTNASPRSRWKRLRRAAFFPDSKSRRKLLTSGSAKGKRIQ